MIALPFIIFLILLFNGFRKKGTYTYTYILLIFSITFFCSILIDVNNYYTKNSCPNIDLGVIAPIIFVALLCFCIKPFERMIVLNQNTTKDLIETIRPRIYNFVVYVYFCAFVIIFTVSLTRLQVILFESELASVRDEFYTREVVSFYDHLRGFPRYVCAFCSELAASSYLMILFLGINIVILKKKWWFNIITLLGSLSGLLKSINIADRSGFVNWLLLFFFVVALFYQLMSHKLRRKIIFSSMIIAGAMLSYILAVTISRFGERDSGTEGGIILYAGQNYINFCRFFNTLEHDHHSLVVIFPMITRYLFDGLGYFDIAKVIEAQSRQPICVFSTFLGFIMSISGVVVSIIYSIVYHFLCQRFKLKLSFQGYNIKNLIILWCLSVVLVLGLFGYFYYNQGGMEALIIWIILSRVLFKKKVSN